MERCRSVLALTVAGLLLAGPAFAQSSAPSGADAPKSQDPAKPADSSSPSASPSTSDTPKSDASQPDAAKSDDAKKSEGAKSEGAKAGRDAVRGNREHVKAAQQALKEKGYDPGTTDGVMGPQTQAALKDFQKAQGLQETGRLDAETMAKLGVEGTTGQTGSSSPAASPQTTPGPAQDKQSPTSKPQTR